MEKLEINKIAFQKFSALTNFINDFSDRIKFVNIDTEHDELDFLDHPEDFYDSTAEENHAAVMQIITVAKNILEKKPEKMIGKKLAGLVADKLSGHAQLLAKIIRDDPDYTRMDFNARTQ